MMKSEELFERAVKRIPGGVNSPVRAYGSVEEAPRFIQRAEGCKVFDADGNTALGVRVAEHDIHIVFQLQKRPLLYPVYLGPGFPKIHPDRASSQKHGDYKGRQRTGYKVFEEKFSFHPSPLSSASPSRLPSILKR